jgi:N-formylglutamate deformylase
MCNTVTINNTQQQTPIVCAIPHSSSFIPNEYVRQFCVSKEALWEESRALVDWYTDDLFAPLVAAGAAELRFNVNRFVLDPERYSEDACEPMAACGMGVIYTHGVYGARLRNPLTPIERERLLTSLYRPYHAALTHLVDATVSRWGYCLIIDAHSFPAKALPYEQKRECARPDICIGTIDPVHTPRPLVQLLRETVEEAGYSVAENEPFAGAILPEKFRGDGRVWSCMLEVNRALYLTTDGYTKSSGYPDVKRFITQLAERLSKSVAAQVRMDFVQ